MEDPHRKILTLIKQCRNTHKAVTHVNCEFEKAHIEKNFEASRNLLGTLFLLLKEGIQIHSELLSILKTPSIRIFYEDEAIETLQADLDTYLVQFKILRDGLEHTTSDTDN